MKKVLGKLSTNAIFYIKYRVVLRSNEKVIKKYGKNLVKNSVSESDKQIMQQLDVFGPCRVNILQK